MKLIIFACLIALTSARPSFIAVPADQIAFVDLSRVHVRVPRQTLSPPPPPPQFQQALYNQLDDEYQPVALPQYQQEPIALAPPLEPHQQQQQQLRVATLQQQTQDAAHAASLGASQRLSERPPDFGEYVDFGAHTGDNGAFGWYADYPVNQYEDHTRY